MFFLPQKVTNALRSARNGHAKGTFVLSQCVVADLDNQVNQGLRSVAAAPTLSLVKPGVACSSQGPKMYFCPGSVWPGSCALPRTGHIDLKLVPWGEGICHSLPHRDWIHR